MDSIWVNTTQRPQFDALAEHMKTDVLIVGGGMAGILCAHMLARAGVDYLLVEAGRICGGVTQNTTAKLTFQHGLIYDKLIRTLGIEDAQRYLAANWAALEEYRTLCRAIDCDFAEQDAFVYALDDRRKLEREAAALARLGVAATVVDRLPFPFATAGGVRVAGQAQFHPLKFAYALAQGLNIRENTRVLALKRGAAVTDRGTISAEKIIVTTHFPFLNTHGGYFLKLYQHRSYVLALRGASDVRGMYVDESGTGLSFRNCGDLLLLGGGAHRTGKKGGGWQALSDVAHRHYPAAREVGRWATQDCMSLDGIPYIGTYARRTPDLYVASGFNKWGMTSSMAAAMILRDLVLGRENAYAAVFSPSRSILHPQLAVNLAETTLGLLTPTVPRCPHLGCALQYNRQEHSWDCACHGSRFAEDGTLLNNPANGNKRR